MIEAPFETLIAKINEKSGLSFEEINQKIDEKMKQLSGLISKEGAAHIIANELGIELFKTAGKLKIKEILSGMRSVEVAGKVQNVSEIREFQTEKRKGKVANIFMADETGSMRVVLWGSQTDIIPKIKQGDIIKINNAYTKENNGFAELHLNDRSKLLLNPEGESIGEIKKRSFERKKLQELREGMSNVELLGTIVQIFDPRFFEVCPDCQKRVRLKEESYNCDEHGKVQPDFSYVLNFVLDDGSETMRIVCFRDQAEQLTERKKDQLLLYKDNAPKFEEIKTELLGKIIKARGRANKNQMFDRLEFMANFIDPNPDPEEELNLLKKEIEERGEAVSVEDV